MTSNWCVEAICSPTNLFEAANLLQVFRRNGVRGMTLGSFSKLRFFIIGPPTTNVFEGGLWASRNNRNFKKKVEILLLRGRATEETSYLTAYGLLSYIYSLV